MSFCKSWFVCALLFVSEVGHQELCAQDLLWHNTAAGQLATWAISPTGGVVKGRQVLSRLCIPSNGCISSWKAVGTGDFAKDVSIGPPFGVHLLVGGVPLALGNYIAINTLHTGASQYGVLACSDGSACQGLVFSLLLNDSSGRAMSSDALPLATPPDLQQFEPATFRLSGAFTGSQIEIEGSVDTLSELSSVAAPEPGTLGFFWTAFAFTASMGWVKARFR